jgi:hypothetical protein
MFPLFFLSRAVFMGLAQIKDQKEKKIGKAAYPNEPVEIVTIGNEKKRFSINENFEQETDWLKGFSMKVKNNSGKSIIYFSWQLEFPETGATGNMMGFPMYYGRHR